MTIGHCGTISTKRIGMRKIEILHVIFWRATLFLTGSLLLRWSFVPLSTSFTKHIQQFIVEHRTTHRTIGSHHVVQFVVLVNTFVGPPNAMFDITITNSYGVFRFPRKCVFRILM